MIVNFNHRLNVLGLTWIPPVIRYIGFILLGAWATFEPYERPQDVGGWLGAIIVPIWGCVAFVRDDESFVWLW